MNRLDKLLALTSRQRCSLMEAALWLWVARLVLLLVPFRRLVACLERQQVGPPEERAGGDLAWLDTVAWAVATGSRHLPWKCTCLAQALAAKAMVQRRGLASTLYLGLAKDGEAHLRAHAWLQCGARVLTGEEQMAGFTTIASFPTQRAARPYGDGPQPLRARPR